VRNKSLAVNPLKMPYLKQKNTFTSTATTPNTTVMGTTANTGSGGGLLNNGRIIMGGFGISNAGKNNI
jgi:hypothetical protein